MKIRISWAKDEITATLDNTATAKKVFAALPCISSANTWGDEVYFSLPVQVALEADARQVVDPGTVCFWVEGSSLALPFGPTPISEDGECRLVSRVNILGKLDGDAEILRSIRDGDKIRVEQLNQGT